MALKLVRFVGTITASTLGDDAAHGLELGKLSIEKHDGGNVEIKPGIHHQI